MGDGLSYKDKRYIERKLYQCAMWYELTRAIDGNEPEQHYHYHDVRGFAKKNLEKSCRDVCKREGYMDGDMWLTRTLKYVKWATRNYRNVDSYDLYIEYFDYWEVIDGD